MLKNRFKEGQIVVAPRAAAAGKSVEESRRNLGVAEGVAFPRQEEVCRIGGVRA